MSAGQSKKTVFITGCTPGSIGYSLAQEFQSRNCNVIASARRPEVLAQLADSGFTAVALDLNDEKSIAAAKARVDELTGGKLDILVNNAGARYVMPLADAALDRVRDVFETNVVSVIGLTNAMLPLLLASEGLVVNISSYSDRLPYPFKGVYAMSKAALTAYSRNLSVELAEFNVRVLNVVTSFVQSQGQSGVLEPWPPGSLYASLQGVGQKVGSGKRMTADEYAVHVVTEALRGKGWDIGPWRFFGTREMMRLGSQSWRMFLLEILGEGWKRFMVLKMWPFWKLRGTTRDKKRA